MKRIGKKMLWLISVIMLLFCSVFVTEAAAPKVRTLKWSNVKESPFCLDKGSDKTLKVSIKPSGAKKRALKWISSDTRIATVSAKGKVHAKKTGTVKIKCKVKSQPSKKITCVIRVIKPVKKINVDTSDVTLKVGDKFARSATVSPQNATIKTVKYKSSSSNVVSVDKKGTLTAKKPGSAVIKISSEDGRAKKVSYKVEVIDQRETGDVKYIGHRGLRSRAPENTVKSFQMAGEAGFWGAECDILETKDGEFVLMHDTTLTRMCGVNKQVKDLTLKQIRKIPIIHGNNYALYKNDSSATTIPTLREYLEVCLEYNMVPVIEIKKQVKPASMKKLHSQVKAITGDREVIYVSQSMDDLAELRNQIGGSDRFSLQHVTSSPAVSYISRYKEYHIDLSAKYTELSKEVLKKFIQEGIAVDVWTVNLSSIAANYTDWGVSYIVTDYVLW